ncbi:MAG: hypothetical protein ACLUNZ_08685 [Evtepia sp.]
MSWPMFSLFRSMHQLMEKAAAAERAGWFDYLLEQQELYYEQYQADLEDASRIRHDIRNQLQTAYTLMEQHDGPGASAILNGVSDQLEQHPDYCPNRLLNALLSVKGNLFTQAGLPFQFDCALPELLPFLMRPCAASSPACWTVRITWPPSAHRPRCRSISLHSSRIKPSPSPARLRRFLKRRRKATRFPPWNCRSFRRPCRSYTVR